MKLMTALIVMAFAQSNLVSSDTHRTLPYLPDKVLSRKKATSTYAESRDRFLISARIAEMKMDLEPDLRSQHAERASKHYCIAANQAFHVDDFTTISGLYKTAIELARISSINDPDKRAVKAIAYDIDRSANLAMELCCEELGGILKKLLTVEEMEYALMEVSARRLPFLPRLP